MDNEGSGIVGVLILLAILAFVPGIGAVVIGLAVLYGIIWVISVLFSGASHASRRLSEGRAPINSREWTPLPNESEYNLWVHAECMRQLDAVEAKERERQEAQRLAELPDNVIPITRSPDRV